ncbi:MAG: hypothetical protein JWL71_2615, partial [Acidobacteria bacterium]|nr:hypothetical protein [Acidobacteriota bacterium]
EVPRSIARTGLGAAVILISAGGLFWIKVRRLVMYALMELALGAVMAGMTMYRLIDEIALFEIASVIAAVYFVVRGLDNLKKGLEEKNG